MPVHPYLATSGALYGLLPLTIGLNALLRPSSGLAVFQIPPPREPYGHKVALGLIRIYGARNTTLGACVLAMWYYSDFRMMGWACLGSCLMALTDGFVARNIVGRTEWNHWGIVPLGLGLGLAFLRAEGVA